MDIRADHLRTRTAATENPLDPERANRKEAGGESAEVKALAFSAQCLVTASRDWSLDRRIPGIKIVMTTVVPTCRTQLGSPPKPELGAFVGCRVVTDGMCEAGRAVSIIPHSSLQQLNARKS